MALRRGRVGRIASRRTALLVAAAVALVLAGLAAMETRPGGDAIPPAPLADQLEPRTWALALPMSWLSTPIPDTRPGDVLDLIGARTGERATAVEVATGLRVMSVSERSIVVELTDDAASAIASARARGLALVPILRSSR